MVLETLESSMPVASATHSGFINQFLCSLKWLSVVYTHESWINPDSLRFILPCHNEYTLGTRTVVTLLGVINQLQKWMKLRLLDILLCLGFSSRTDSKPLENEMLIQQSPPMI